MKPNLIQDTIFIIMLLLFSIIVYYLEAVPTLNKHIVAISCISLSQVYLMRILNVRESLFLIILKIIGNLLGILK